MAKIVFFPDREEGHLFPTFGLARSLADRGHEVHYVGILHNREAVLKFGFIYHVIFNNFFPEGYMENFKKQYRQGMKSATTDYITYLLGESMELDDIMKDLQPDLLISTFFLPLESLILCYRYNIPQIILTPMIRKPEMNLVSNCINQYTRLPGDIAYGMMNFFIKKKGKAFKNLAEIVAPLEQIPELILCPIEFVLPDSNYSSNVYFIEPSIRKDALVETTCSLSIPEGKRLIYASLGSQTFNYGELCRKFFYTIMEVMRSESAQNWHLILSIGSEFIVEEFKNIPGNVLMLNWVPQIEVLKTSALAITHGGLGTVKECIFFGVPMIVLPLVNDQPSNAKLVEYYGLGVKKDLQHLSIEELESSMLYLLNDSSVRENVMRMQTIFQEKEKLQVGVNFIEEMISK